MSFKLEKEVAWESSIRGILHRQLFVHPKPLPPSVSLSGEIGLITGANGGLGLEAARQLLRLGLSGLILAVRSQTKGEDASRRLSQEFPNVEIHVWVVDMADYDSIIAFADRCRKLERLDFAILNAGVQLSSFSRCEKTGHEMTIQTNYLSTVLLVLLLTTFMKEKKGREAGKPPIISIVGSDTMYFSKFETSGPILPQLDDPARFSGFQQYRDSKMLLMMFISRLAEQANSDDVLINVCNPGLTAGTELQRDNKNTGFATRLVIPPFVKIVGRSVEAGASIYVHALVAEGRESHGSFVSDWSIKP
ncbi:Short chain dehydrogenase sol3 [Lasiodiplodia hormozganensis]|uniref:Short chain dehydrogenase sol3 n=1 Tax=Lasiodiplodia hormozganensis TaxID=869390 RepID=A0AA39XZX1_9PEZI|nr:Short chain dehydrogenase sol3 [Lasiodiplodia hormozganensis]